MLQMLRPKIHVVDYECARVKRTGFFTKAVAVEIFAQSERAWTEAAAWQKALDKLWAADAEIEALLREASSHKTALKRAARKTLFPGRLHASLERLNRQSAGVRALRSKNRTEIRRVSGLVSSIEMRNAARSAPFVTNGWAVYSIDCEDSIYVGLTNNPPRRFREHLRRSHNAGVRKMISGGATPNIFASGLSKHEALVLEKDLIKRLRRTSKKVVNLTEKWAAKRPS